MVNFKFSRLLSSPFSIPLTLALGGFVLYATTASPTNVSYADSDFLTTVGYFLGVAHPPGYPIHILLTHLFTHLPLPFSVAYKAHLLSAFFHSATLAVTYTGVRRFIASTAPKSTNTARTTISLVSTLTLAFAHLFWLYSIVHEKYALNDFFIAIIITLGVYLLSSSSPISKITFKLSCLTLIFFLGLNHHQTLVLLSPAILYLYWYLRSRLTLPIITKQITIALITFSFGLLLLLFLNTTPAPVTWNFSNTISGILENYQRKELSGYLLVSGKSRGLYLMDISPSILINKLPDVFSNLTHSLHPISFFSVLAGLFLLLKKPKPPSSTFILIVTIFTLIFIPLYVDWPQTLSEQAIRIRMYLAAIMVTPYLTSIFFASLLTSQRLNRLRFPLILLILPLTIFTDSLPKTSLRSSTLNHDLYRDMLTSLPPNSSLACISDVSCFALIYLHFVEEVRPDIILIPHATQLIEHYLSQHPHISGFDYPSNPERFIDLLTWDLSHRNVFITDLQQIYYHLLGFDYGFLFYQPSGYYGQLSQTFSPASALPNYQLSQTQGQLNFWEFDLNRRQFQASLFQKHLLNANIYRLTDQPDLIPAQLRLAQSLAVHLPENYQQQLNSFNQDQESPKSQYIPGLTNPSLSQIFDHALNLQPTDPFQAWIGYQAILTQDPLNHQARIRRDNIYSPAVVDSDAIDSTF